MQHGAQERQRAARIPARGRGSTPSPTPPPPGRPNAWCGRAAREPRGPRRRRPERSPGRSGSDGHESEAAAAPPPTPRYPNPPSPTPRYPNPPSPRPQLLTPPTCSDDRLSVDGECRAGRREGGAPLGCTDSSRSVCMQGGGVPRHAALGCSSPRPPTTRGQRLRGCKRGVAMCSGCETLVSLLSMICCTPVFSGAPSRVCAVA